MKYSMHLFIFTIIAQMALAPFKLSLVSSKAYAQSAEDCSSRGMVQDPATGRCILPQQVTTTKIEAAKCESLSGKAYSDCHKKSAKTGVAEVERSEGLKRTDGVSSGNFHRYGIPVTVGFVAGYYMLTKRDTLNKCAQASMYLILGGAASAMVTELMAQTSYQKKLKSLVKDYEKEIAQSRSDEKNGVVKDSEAQTMALNLMIDQEKARKDAASTRQGGHSLAAALYGAGAIAAVYEQFTTGGSCSASVDKVKLKNMWLDPTFREEFKEYSYLEEINAQEFMELVARKLWANIGFQNALAQESPEPVSSTIKEDTSEPISLNDTSSLANSSSRTGDFPDIKKIFESAGELKDKISSWVDQGVKTPWVRGALAGTLGVYSMALVKNAKENKKIASKRINAIKEIQSTYADSGGVKFLACGPEDKKNPGKPECYCYNDDGTVNQVRVNRKTCLAYASDKRLSATDYGGSRSSGYMPVKACLKSDGQIDKDCRVCEKSPSRCPVIAKAQIGQLNLGGGIAVSELVKKSNALNTGRLSGSDLNAGSLEQAAMRYDDAKDKLASDSKYADTIKKMDKLSRDFQKAAPALLRRSMAQNPQLLASLASTGAGNSATDVQEVLKDNKSAIELFSGKEVDERFISTSKTNTSATPNDLDFGFGDSGGGVEVQDSADIMQKDFAITGDIHKNPDNNIFQILSLRYQRSGLRRLFDMEGRSKADAASESTINER